jgi:hypothetical protein
LNFGRYLTALGRADDDLSETRADAGSGPRQAVA